MAKNYGVNHLHEKTISEQTPMSKTKTFILVNRISLAITICSVCLCLPAVSAQASDRPHVVIFVSDDMGWNDVGYHGGNIHTPNIDRLAKEGMQLDRFYVHPICSPTRTAMMTGRSPARFGITSPLGGDRAVPTDEHFMPESFQNAGYQTFMVGKWHLGAVGDEFSPQSRGFDHFYGFRGGAIDYYTHTAQGQLDWQRNGKPLEESGYSTDLFAAEVVRLIERRERSKPVFLYVAFNAPHGPTQAPDELIRKYAYSSRRGKMGSYAAAVDSMDQAIGKILDALRRERMTENTLAMFFCDNGGKGSKGGREQSVNSNGLNLRGGKGELLEGGIRVPAVIRWPGVIRSGTRCQQMISALDLLPTLTAAAAIPTGTSKPLDGLDMWPAISSGEQLPRRPIIIAGQRGSFAAIDDSLKLIRDAGGVQLYDVRRDPIETNNLAGQRPEDVARLEAAFSSLQGLTTQRGPRRDRSRDVGRISRLPPIRKQPRRPSQ